MRQRVSHRHRRIMGRIAVCLLVTLAGGAALAILSADATHADDAAVNQTGIQASIQASIQTGNQVVDQTGEHANQLFILGQNRESGEWVRPSLVQAYMWYLLATAAGHGQAAAARERIAIGMTAEQITSAWSRAGHCLASGYLYCDDWAEP